jgi:hypothetical protein
MFIPGLRSSAAKAVTVLSGLMNGPSRTNVGIYNPNDVSVTATVRLFDGAVLLGSVSVNLGPKGGTQVSNIYKTVGFETLVRTDGYCTVDSGGALPLFAYAAMADNATQDTILVVGAEDAAAPPGFNPPTPTPTPGGSTATPTPPGPTATPTRTPTSAPMTVVNLAATCWVWSFNGGSSSFIMKVGQAYELHISNGDSVGQAGCRAHGFGGVPGLGIPRQSPLNPGSPPAIVTFTPSTGQVGTFGFACDQSGCGVGHNQMFGSIQVVP